MTTATKKQFEALPLTTFRYILDLVPVLCRVVLWRDDETAPLSRSSVDGLDNIDHLLLVVDGPVDLVVVPRPQVDHDVLVPVEEHDGARVVELVHCVEVGHLKEMRKNKRNVERMRRRRMKKTRRRRRSVEMRQKGRVGKNELTDSLHGVSSLQSQNTHLGDIDEIDDGVILHELGDRIEDLIHLFLGGKRREEWAGKEERTSSICVLGGKKKTGPHPRESETVGGRWQHKKPQAGECEVQRRMFSEGG